MIDLQNFLLLLIGGGGIAGIISAFLTYRAKQGETELDMIDKLSAEITRLDTKIKEMEILLDEKDNEIDKWKKEYRLSEESRDQLQRIVSEMRSSIDMLTREVSLLKGERQ